MSWDFIGNEQAVAVLARDLQRGVPVHAYLFAGPDGIGKRTLALRLAQSLNCAASTAGEPCGECRSCRRIGQGLHADVQIVSVPPADEDRQHKEISVEQIREIERAIALNPFEGRTRVVIIDPADAMSVAAQNAFLKTLEEPSPRVCLALVTSRPAQLLETVRSRCRRLEMRFVPVAVVEGALLDRGLEPTRAGLLARLSRGRAAWALAVARDPSLLEWRESAIATARSLPQLTLAQRFDLAERVAADFRKGREAVLALLGEWQAWWRDVALAGAGVEDGIINVDYLQALRSDGVLYPSDEVVPFLRLLGRTTRLIEGNVQPRLALEALLLDAPQAAINAQLP